MIHAANIFFGKGLATPAGFCFALALQTGRDLRLEIFERPAPNNDGELITASNHSAANLAAASRIVIDEAKTRDRFVAGPFDVRPGRWLWFAIPNK